MKTTSISLPDQTILLLAALAQASLRANGKITLPRCVAVELVCALPSAPTQPITEADLTELERLELRCQQAEGKPSTPADVHGVPVSPMLETAYRYGLRRRAERQASGAKRGRVGR